uniref:Ferredoxin-thioredoxin reductase catalytic chain, chloroplastic n=1 Tax=Leersia perrieri TaxID=77586 RepID=A0A0D9XH62_9ORYZ
MRERKECYCMLFLTPDNDFAGEDQACLFHIVSCTTNRNTRAFHYEDMLANHQ